MINYRNTMLKTLTQYVKFQNLTWLAIGKSGERGPSVWWPAAAASLTGDVTASFLTLPNQISTVWAAGWTWKNVAWSRAPRSP